MKKTVLFLSLVLIISVLFTACTNPFLPSEKDTPTPTQQSAETPSPSIEPTQNPDSDEGEGSQELKVIEGEYQGQADSNFVEVKLKNNEGEESYKVFMLSETIKDSFDQLGLNEKDWITITYYINKDGHWVITKIEKS